MSYQVFRDAWLDVKREIVYQLRDECDRIAVTSGYCNGRKREDDAGTMAIC